VGVHPLLPVLLATLAPQDGVRFGYSVCALSDVDGDGVQDFAVGAPYASTAREWDGMVLIFSGRSRSVIRSLAGSGERRWFGSSLRNVGDVDDNGIDDLLVGLDGAPEVLAGGCDYRWHGGVYRDGNVRLFSGKTGQLLWRLGVDDVPELAAEKDPPARRTRRR